MKVKITKKNQIILGMIICFLIIIFFVEEKNILKSSDYYDSEHSILENKNWGEWQSISGERLGLDIKKMTLINNSKIQLSKERVNGLVMALSLYQIKKSYRLNEVPFNPIVKFKLIFNFEHAQVEFTLGDKSPISHQFYLKIKVNNEQEKILLVEDQGEDPNVYHSDDEYRLSDYRYLKARSLFNSADNFFYEPQIFPKKLNGVMRISTFRNRAFYWNIDQRKTNPLPPDLVEQNSDAHLDLLQQLQNLKAQFSYYPVDVSALKEPLAEWELSDAVGEKTQYTLYRIFGDLKGNFIKSNKSPLLYSIRPSEARLLLINIQDFWVRSLIKNKSQIKNMKIGFYNGKFLEAKIDWDQEFIVTLLSHNKNKAKINFESFLKLSKILMQPADRVDIFQADNKMTWDQFLKNAVLSLELNRIKNISVVLVDDELILVDLSSKTLFHYYIGNSKKQIPVEISYERYLTLL